MNRLPATVGRLWRGRAERGASSVLVALLMVPLIGFAAVSIDIASLWADKQRLYAGADAAALAIAQDCAHNNCGTPSSTASTYVKANGLPAASATLKNAVTPTTGTVTVKASAVRQHWFAPVLGVKSNTVTAQGSADWGGISGGATQIPVTFSWCAFKAQTGGGIPSSTTPYTVKLSSQDGTSCVAPTGKSVPGGFGWLTPNNGNCGMSTKIKDKPLTSTGNAPPQTCGNDGFAALQNKTVLIPIYADAGGTGTAAWYEVYGYAAFKITGYYFAGQYSFNDPCAGNDRCIRGYFTQFVDLTNQYTWSATAPVTGSTMVKLTSKPAS